MSNKDKYTLDYIRKENLILFECITGSYAYGTYIEGVSDKDIRGVFIMKQEDLYGLDYVEQVNDDKNDIVFYEIGRFLKLLYVNNPNILELLAHPEDCVISKHPLFDLIIENKDEFITKMCRDSFGGYGRKQLKKSASQDKLMNWELDKVTRKEPIDFCFVIEDYKTRSLKSFLEEKNMEQKFCGVVNVPNARDVFTLFYDKTAEACFSERFSENVREINKRILKESNGVYGLGYKGLEKDDEQKGKSNALRLSSIPKGEDVICIFCYNKDAYSQHCLAYNKYQNWLIKKNPNRWVETNAHGQRNEDRNSKIDAKNMLHCMRLIDMSTEISEGKGIIVKRPNVQELLNIRMGKVNLNALIETAEEKIKKMDELFENSNLPEKVDYDFTNNLLRQIRIEFYAKNQ